MGRSQHVGMHCEVTVQSLLYQVYKAKNQLKEQVIRKKKTWISRTNPILWFRGQAKPIEWFHSLLRKPKGLTTLSCHFSDTFLSQIDFFRDRTLQSPHFRVKMHTQLCFQTVCQIHVSLFIAFQLFMAYFLKQIIQNFIFIVKTKKKNVQFKA